MSASAQQQFLPRIESLRGLAALTVALMHVTMSWFAAQPRGDFDQVGLKAIKAMGNGFGAVVAFFVISGFVLARSLDRDFNATRFIRARIFRLFPAAISTICIFAALFYAFGFNLYEEEGAVITPLNIVANMLMLHTDIDKVMWSMKAELAATPLIFLCVWLFRRYGERPVIAIAWLLFALSFLGQYCHAIGNDTNLSPLYAFPIGVLVQFKGAALAKRLGANAVPLCALASIGLFWTCSFLKPEGTWMALVECLSAATLVMLVAYRTDTAAFAPLDLPIVRFYGRISYSFYLLHPLSLWTAARLTSYLWVQYSWLPVTLILAASFLYSLIFTTPLAFLSWRYVEQPALKWRSARRPAGPLAVSGDVRLTP
ncbi:MAG: acyltransferase [Bradyrhizobium sp.]|nr:acyltransferase [Bradyrhizobium sp.]